jgi:hypothetical protein
MLVSSGNSVSSFFTTIGSLSIYSAEGLEEGDILSNILIRD